MITEAAIEKAFADPVEFRLAPWREETGLRRPTVAEIKARLAALLSASNTTEAIEDEKKRYA